MDFHLKGNRILKKYLAMSVIVFSAGLLSRTTLPMPSWFHRYGGDTLWAMFVFLLLTMLSRRVKTHWLALTALIFSYLIEVSQLYHSPWLETIRATTVGGLILGFGFLWSDLVCYTVGVLLGVSMDCLLLARDYPPERPDC